jgi:BlaI family transcriptional regulator, penicillinase repressor
MAGRKAITFTEVELEFMQIIWTKGEITTESLQYELKLLNRPLSNGAIRKILSILMAKGHLNRRRQGKSYYFTPKILKDQGQKNIIHDIMKRAFDNSASKVIAALLDTKNVSDDDIKDMKQLINNYKK